MISTATATEIAVIFLGVCLLGIIGALILSPNFRSDLSANPGKLSFFGASVEGVVIVLIIGALIASIVVCAQIIADIEMKK